MLTPPSLQRSSWVCWSRDPALNMPDEPLQPTGDSEADKRAADAWKEWGRRVEQARETGDWTGLTREGQQPTAFEIKPMRGPTLRAILDNAVAGRIGAATMMALAFRACVRGVRNLGDAVIRVQPEEPYGALATSDIVDLLDGIDPGIVGELGDYCLSRARSPSPK